MTENRHKVGNSCAPHSRNEAHISHPIKQIYGIVPVSCCRTWSMFFYTLAGVVLANIDKLWQSDLCLDKLFVRSNIIKYVYWIHLSQKLQNNYNLRLTDLDAGVCSSSSGKYSGKVLFGIAVKFLFWLLLPVWVEEENGTFTYKIHLLYIYIYIYIYI